MTKAEKTRLWYQKNKERKKEYNKMYWTKNKLRLKIKKYYETRTNDTYQYD
jgi:hypothetical protein